MLISIVQINCFIAFYVQWPGGCSTDRKQTLGQHQMTFLNHTFITSVESFRILVLVTVFVNLYAIQISWFPN